MLMKRKENIYISIVPGLVTFTCDYKRIFGSYLFQALDFFPNTYKKAKFHYSITIGDISIPSESSFRNGYYFKEGNSWYYKRKIFGITLKLRYNIADKTFRINKAY